MKKIYAEDIYKMNTEIQLLAFAEKQMAKKIKSKPFNAIRKLDFKVQSQLVSVYYLNKAGEFHIDYVHGLPQK